MSTSELEDLQRSSGLIGEDAAVFSFGDQSLKSWGAFLAVLGTVLTALYFLWLNPETGYGEFRLRVLKSQYDYIDWVHPHWSRFANGKVILYARWCACSTPTVLGCAHFLWPVFGKACTLHAIRV